jgi:lipoprotein-releasing system permease protein
MKNNDHSRTKHSSVLTFLSSLYIALRFLWGRAGEGGRYLRGAAAGIALSLIPIMVTLVVADGMIRGITDRYLELGTGHVQVYDYMEYYDIPVLAEEIGGMKHLGIRGAWSERQGLGIILGNSGRTGVTIRAVDQNFWEDPGSRAFLQVVSGSAVLGSDREVLLGQGLAETLRAEPGKTVRIMTVRTDPDGAYIPRVTLFTVKGIISSGYRELDSLWCIMNYSAGEELLSPLLYHSFIMVKVDDPYTQPDNTAAALVGEFGPGFGIYTWKQLNQSLYRSFESTKQILLFIMALLVIVAAVNVSSATSMLALERQREIAVLKTGGAGPGQTTAVFLWGSLLTGLIGAVSGLSLGLLLGRFINPLIRRLESILSFFSSPWGGEVKLLDPDYYLQEIPIIIDWKAVLFIGIFTIFCSCAASVLPARRAGKLRPLEILRKI